MQCVQMKFVKCLSKAFLHHVPNSAHLVGAQRGFTEIFAVFAAQAVYHLSKAGGWNLFLFFFPAHRVPSWQARGLAGGFSKTQGQNVVFYTTKWKTKKMYKISNTSSHPWKRSMQQNLQNEQGHTYNGWSDIKIQKHTVMSRVESCCIQISLYNQICPT